MAQKLLIAKLSGQILINRMDCQPKMGHSYFERCSGKNPGYFMIVNGSEECSIWVAVGRYNFVVGSDEAKAKIRKVMKMEDMSLP